MQVNFAVMDGGTPAASSSATDDDFTPRTVEPRYDSVSGEIPAPEDEIAPPVVGSKPEQERPDSSESPTATAAPVYQCDNYGQLPRYNTVATNAADYYNWYVFPNTKVGDGSGNINWTLDPYADLGWTLWFSSLRWIGPSIEAARKGDGRAFIKAETIIKDWIRDHPVSWLSDLDDIEANTHRLNVLICFREVVMLRNGGTFPSSYQWLLDSLHLHAKHNIARWSGAHNHGTSENRALLGLGCLINRRDYQEIAVSRVEEAYPYQMDAQGLSNEASPMYADYNYRLFRQVRDLMTRCGWTSTLVNNRLGLMGDAIGHMVNGTGKFFQYGDTEVSNPVSPGTPGMLWAATNGQQGSHSTSRIRIFKAGPVFGRSSWGTRETGFANEVAWLLRGGTGKEKKAHRGDLLQLLFTARGREIVIDAGHPGIVGAPWEPWGRGPLAHNTINIPTLDMTIGGTASVSRYSFPTNGKGDYLEMTQSFGAKGNRTRGILMMKGPDAAVVLDRTVIVDSTKRHTIQTQWAVPADQTTTVPGRSVARSAAPSNTLTTFVHVPFWGVQEVQRGETQLYRGVVGTTPRGHWYPLQQQRQPTDQLVFSRFGNRVGTISVIVPARKTAGVGVTRSKYPDGATKLVIRIGTDVIEVRITAGGYMSQVR
ncbi:heparinase II/III domain-containing protein [Neomicrococcus lactis]|uniref:heparinase II/III domain-containing protein n=1 Tax=Neomicrococcus lactis TaxID=732241 RepID=UPI0023015F54|nr:heparinase II/III family protein [Neomicrococcus lactis]